MPTVWPPQGEPSFEFKMPCCSCSTGCKSISGTLPLGECGVDYNVYPPTVTNPPTFFTYSYTYNNPTNPPPGPKNFHVAFRLDFTDNCNGTTTVTLTSFTVTSTDPDVLSIYNLALNNPGFGYFPTTMVLGDSFTYPGCGHPGASSGIFAQWNFDYTADPGQFFTTPDTGANAGTWGQSPSNAQVATILSFLLSDPSSPWPADTVPNCALGKISLSRCPNSVDFNYFENTFRFTGLTVGAQYCAQITYEFQPIAGGAWADLETVCVQFTATGTTDQIDNIFADAISILNASPGGCYYRIKAGSPVLTLDPTGSICGAC